MELIHFSFKKYLMDWKFFQFVISKKKKKDKLKWKKKKKKKRTTGTTSMTVWLFKSHNKEINNIDFIKFYIILNKFNVHVFVYKNLIYNYDWIEKQ